MKRISKIYWFAGVFVLTILFSLSLPSCGTTKKSKIADQRKGFMLMNKSEYSMNKGRYKETKRPKAIRKRKKMNKKKH